MQVSESLPISLETKELDGAAKPRMRPIRNISKNDVVVEFKAETASRYI